ncbi:hypothetical protein AB988_3569 [Acinetobacter baumannii]|nr:hypothetical protein AB988_3569 [Acinetobacter baumannii]
MAQRFIIKSLFDCMVQLLDPNKPDERKRLLEYFLLQLL